MHFVVFGGIEQAQVQLSLVSYRLSHGRDLLLHHIQRGVHGVMEFQLILNRHAANVQRIVLQGRNEQIHSTNLSQMSCLTILKKPRKIHGKI